MITGAGDDAGTYNRNNQIKLKTTMLKSSLCDYSEAYILVKGRKTITGARDDVASKQADEKKRSNI